MTIRDYHRELIRRLRLAAIPEAEIDAGLLLRHYLGCSQAALVLAGTQPVPVEVHRAVENGVARRLKREPLAYILGEQEFWSLDFEVSPAVLIPRSETELLVEAALTAARREELARHGYIFDLGTGSGIIAVTLALELPEASVFGIDRSLPALQMAWRNGRRHGVSSRLHLLNGDWLTSLQQKPLASLIVANPPYIAREVLETLQPEVRLYEPRSALDGGNQGIECLDLLARQAGKLLVPGGWLFMEIGADQERHALEQFRGMNLYEQVAVRPDYAGLPRILQARRFLF